MSRWFKVNSDLLNDMHVQLLSPRKFKRALLEAMAGIGDGPLRRFVVPDNGRPGGEEWAALRADVFERDDFTCRYCGERGGKLECDHIVPVSRGGDSRPENLTTACFRCNRSKRNKLVSEWRQ